MSEQIKVMYYAPLPEGRDHATFQERWRAHGRLAMSLPMWEHVVRYVQYDSLVAGQHGVAAEVLAGLHNARYGGIGAVWFRSAEAMAEAVTDPDLARLRDDEVETFGRALGAELVPTREVVLLDRGPAPITVLNQLHRPAGVTREAFSEQWLDMGRQVLARPRLERHLRRYIENHALPDAEAWDGMVELGFDAAADFFAFMAEPETSEWLFPHESAFIDIPRGQPLITAPATLYDETAG